MTRATTRHPIASLPPRAWWSAVWIAGVALLVACGGDVESRMVKVRALQNAGRFDQSIAELESIVATSPDLPEANYRLGLALVQTGDRLRAVAPLEKAADSSQYEISAGVLLAATYFQSQSYERAIAAADRVLQSAPDREAALRIRASAHVAANQLEEALEDTSRLVELDPGDYGVRTLHASVLSRLGRLEEARGEYDLLKQMGVESDDPDFRDRACLAPAAFAQDVLKDTERAKALYDDCASHTPTSTLVINHLVSFYDQIDDPERGTTLWRDAVAAEPSNLALRRGLAARLVARGKTEEAEQVLRDAVASLGSAASWNLLANFYRASQEPQKAVEAIEKALELSQGDDEQLRYLLGDVLIDLGELDRAREVSDELTQEAYAELLRGRIYLATSEPGKALEAFEKGIRAWPDNAGAHLLAGNAARELGDYDRAISEFSQALRANDADAEAALELAGIFHERGQHQRAIRFANQAMRSRDRPRPAPYVISARSWAALGHPERARQVLASLRERGYASIATRELVLLERRVSGPEEAVRVALESGLDLADPANLQVLQQVVDAEVAQGRFASAVSRVEKALARDPDDPEFLALLGYALSSSNRLQEAEAAFDQALARDADNSAALAGLARLRLKADDAKAAIELFDRAYAVPPHELSYAYSAAQLVRFTGDEEAAVKRLRDIVKHHPDAVGARTDLARILAESGQDLDFALSLAREARRIDASPEVLETLGWVHYLRGEFEQAVEVLEAAAQAQPSSPGVHYRLALALLETGDEGRAKEMLTAALAAGSFPEAADARSRLARLADH